MKMTSPNIRNDLWLEVICLAAVIVGTVILFASRIGAHGLWDPWESQYARRAIQSEYITPSSRDDWDFTNLSLADWLAALSVRVFGRNEFAVRLPAVFGGILGVLSIYWMLRILKGRQTALMGAGILATIPQYCMMARLATPDMLFTGFLAGAMACFALGRFASSHNRLYFLLFYGCLALAGLIKGPLAGVIVVGAVFFFLLGDSSAGGSRDIRDAFRRFCEFVNRYQLVGGILVLLMVMLSGHALLTAKFGDADFVHTVGAEGLRRFFSSSAYDTTEYHFKTLFHGTFPWIGLAPAAILFGFFGKFTEDDQFQLIWYFSSWLMVSFLVLAYGAAKHPHDILPVTTSLAVLVALVWDEYFQEKAPRWLGAVCILCIPVAYIPIRDFLVESPGFLLEALTGEEVFPNMNLDPALKVFMIAWAGAMILASINRRSAAAAIAAMATAFGFCIYIGHRVIPAQSSVTSTKALVSRWDSLRQPGDVNLLLGKNLDSLVYYFGGDVHVFGRDETEQLLDFINRHPRFYVMTERNSRALFHNIRLRHGYEYYPVPDEYGHGKLYTSVQQPRSFFQ